MPNSGFNPKKNEVESDESACTQTFLELVLFDTLADWEQQLRYMHALVEDAAR